MGEKKDKPPDKKTYGGGKTSKYMKEPKKNITRGVPRRIKTKKGGLRQKGTQKVTTL